jgi:CubicO group peptidase (beta-lactamase class C family)
MMKRIGGLAAAVAIVVSNKLPAQSLPPATQQRLDALAASEYARDSIGSLTIGVVTAQGLAWTKTYGFAEMSGRKLANQQSVYRIGSITKMFTAVMLQQLVAQGKVQLTDPVERYYPEIREIRGYSKLARPITVQQLATMTSGIAREPEQEGPFWTGPVSMWDSTLHLALSHTNMEFTPGTKYMYSNIGYAILGATLARAAGVPYVKWQKENLFAPLDMQHTAFEIEPSILAAVTVGYDVGPNGRPSPDFSSREAITGRGFKVPNGAIYTTVDDLARFLSLLMGRGPTAVVPVPRLDSAYRGVLDASGKPKAEYGIGFSVGSRGPLTVYGHGGAVAGFSAALAFEREHTVGVIVLRNVLGGQANPDRLVTNVLTELVARAKAPATPPSH